MSRYRVLMAALAGTMASAPPRAGSVGARSDNGPRFQASDYHDGHARPRALAYNPGDGLLYVALSTTDELAVVDPGGAASAPRLLRRLPVCRFPGAVAALSGGGALVACRYDPALRRVGREGDRWRVTAVDAGATAGARGLVVGGPGPRAVAYVASPPVRGVQVVSLAGGGVLQTLPTGLSPRALRLVPAGTLPGQARSLLLVSNFVDHTVTAHPIADDGTLTPALQTIRTEAPVLDLFVTSAPDAALYLLTHEDRPLDRPGAAVEGLDSGLLRLEATGAATPFADPGSGHRVFVNLGERSRDPVIELAAVAVDATSGAVGLVGAGSDNLLVAMPVPAALRAAAAVTVGANPTALAALPAGRWVTADRLSDTLTFVSGGAVTALVVGAPRRPSPAERGELLFYSRALVPNNVADGALSLYTCAACHDDGHVDGRRHPAKRNRFFSMTKTCRGLGTTAPYLSLGDPATIDDFADNIVATHAQGAERAPDSFDRYPVTLRTRDSDAWGSVVLPPAQVRTALAQYMERIPPEPSPFVAPGRHALTAAEAKGLALFRDGCAGCHQLVGNTMRDSPIPPGRQGPRLLAGQAALTSPRRYDVGTPVLGQGGNNPPSLRGVWDAAPYFSDGSARTLEQVLLRTDPDAPKVHAPANAGRPPAFSPEERAALLALLRAL